MFVAGMLDIVESLRPLVGKLADEPVGSAEAAELVGLCVEAERLVAAARLMAARAVDSDHWKARGFRSAAAWMAAETGTPVGAAIAHAGRNIKAHQRTALECRDATCIVPGCEIRHGLQIDHRGPYVETHYTSIEALARLRPWHHYQKSHCGYTYRGGPGTWEWIPPDTPPNHPQPTEAPSAPSPNRSLFTARRCYCRSQPIAISDCPSSAPT